MAKETVTIFYDDIDKTEGAETYTFAFQGKSYEIELATKNADKLTKALQPFIDKARQVRNGAAPVATVKKAQAKNDPEFLGRVRTHLRAQGIEVSNQGRIAGRYMDEYLKSGGK